MVKVGIGQDSHIFTDDPEKPCVIGGVVFEDMPGLDGNSDADIVLHALCNAISGISGTVVLGPITDPMCEAGITDSREYVKEALKTLGDYRVGHVSVSIECLRPKIVPKIEEMKVAIARLCGITTNDVGITATTGEGLTDFGKGLGAQAFVSVVATK